MEHAFDTAPGLAPGATDDVLGPALAERWGGLAELDQAWWRAHVLRLRGASLSLPAGSLLQVLASGDRPASVLLALDTDPQGCVMALPMPSTWAADGAEWERSPWRDVLLYDRLQPLLQALATWRGQAVEAPHVSWPEEPQPGPQQPAFGLALRWTSGEQVCDLHLSWADRRLASRVLTAFANEASDTAADPDAAQADEEGGGGPSALTPAAKAGPLLELRPYIPTPSISSADREHLGLGAGLLTRDAGTGPWPLYLRAGPGWARVGTVTERHGQWRVAGIDFEPCSPAPFGLQHWPPVAEGISLLGRAWRISLAELLALGSGTALPLPSDYGLVLLDGCISGTARPTDACGRVWRITGWLQ